MHLNAISAATMNALVTIPFKRQFAMSLPFGVIRSGATSAPQMALISAPDCRIPRFAASLATAYLPFGAVDDKRLATHNALTLFAMLVTPPAFKVAIHRAVFLVGVRWLHVKGALAFWTCLGWAGLGSRLLRSFIPSVTRVSRSAFFGAILLALRSPKGFAAALANSIDEVCRHVGILPHVCNKESYFKWACRYVEDAERVSKTETMFDMAA